MTKGQKIFLIVGLAVLATGTYLFATRKTSGDSELKPNVDKDGNLIDPTKDEYGNPIAAPSGTGSSAGSSAGSSTGSVTYSEDAFPLVFGARGERVKNLQTKLNVSPTSGYLGNKTKAAIEAKGYSIPLSQSNYNKIMGIGAQTSGTGTTGSTTPGSYKAYLKLNDAIVYSYPENNKSYIVGRIKKSIVLDRSIGYVLSSAANGYSKVSLSVAGYDVSGKAKVFSGTYYIRNVELSKTPY